jgi:hypothetical protein
MSLQSLDTAVTSADDHRRSNASSLNKIRTLALERVDRAPFSYVFLR